MTEICDECGSRLKWCNRHNTHHHASFFKINCENMDNNTEAKNMKIEIEMPEKRIQDLLTNALEGGSNYWYQIENYHYPNKCPHCNLTTLTHLYSGAKCPKCNTPLVKATKEDLGIEFAHIELPFKGGFIEFSDLEDEEAEHKNLTIEAIQRAVKIMAEKYPRHFGDWIGENDDAITGDVFLQCCLFGEVIYG